MYFAYEWINRLFDIVEETPDNMMLIRKSVGWKYSYNKKTFHLNIEEDMVTGPVVLSPEMDDVSPTPIVKLKDSVLREVTDKVNEKISLHDSRKAAFLAKTYTKDTKKPSKKIVKEPFARFNAQSGRMYFNQSASKLLNLSEDVTLTFTGNIINLHNDGVGVKIHEKKGMYDAYHSAYVSDIVSISDDSGTGKVSYAVEIDHKGRAYFNLDKQKP